MLEREIEQKLVTETKKRGGVAFKFVSPGYDGVPDRLVLMPDGRMAFVELKAPGSKPRALQKVRICQIRHLGFKVFVVDGKEQITRVLDAIEGKEP